MNIRIIIISIILFFIVVASEYITYASLHQALIIKSGRLEVTIMILGIIMPILFIISMLYSYKHYTLFNSLINTISSVWLGVILYTFLASLIVFILIMLNYYFNLNLPIKLISEILVVFVLIIVNYGIWNASHPRIVRWNISSEALSKDWHNKKILIISDVHLGTVRRQAFLKKVILRIAEEKPDVVFVLGDLIDGSSFPYKEWLNEFSNLKPQFGNLYVEGNHEKYSQEYNKFKSEIPESLVNLTDKKVTLNNTQIIGLDYRQHESLESIKSELASLKYNPLEPSIILMHDPKNVGFLSNLDVSLVLSGHTHGGQLFPFTTLLNRLYQKYTHGINYTGKTASVTSFGVGTSLVPMRIGTTPEIIILNIK